ncbi:MAG: alpha-E domain-containing protein, partial [Pseudomonadota bacterium]
NLLKSLSAKSAYQRSVGPSLDANSVVNFVFTNVVFPRSIANCLQRIEEIIGLMQAPPGLMRELRQTSLKFANFDAEQMSLSELHQFVDEFQAKLASLNNGFEQHWFRGGIQ